jgi:hypothetical protein
VQFDPLGKDQSVDKDVHMVRWHAASLTRYPPEGKLNA